MIGKNIMRFLKFDPFIMGLLTAVLLATLFPCHGKAVPVFQYLAITLIGLMFFLQGARLSRQAVFQGIVAWRLHSVILLCTFVLFPALGLLAHALLPNMFIPEVWCGVLFLCCLPSTVQSSIAFTSIAGGNIPAAVCAATASNILGIFITPALVSVILQHDGTAMGNPMDIVYQLLVPFIFGQICQPFLGAWAHRNKTLLSFTDRGSVLVVVYVAFSSAVVEGLWHKLPLDQLGMIVLADTILLFTVITITTIISRFLHVPYEDEIPIVFCGSKKTLASGIPMAEILFPPSTVGITVIPLMIYHQIQLFTCAVLAQHFKKKMDQISAIRAQTYKEQIQEMPQIPKRV